VTTTVIGANEYEGHYAFDLLYNNTSDIQPDILSSDTHGTNQVNFALLDLFGYAFAPRYAKFKRVFYDMFTIDANVNSGEPFIKLKKGINYQLIVEQWDQIQRIICSLARKKVTQSTLVKKLSTLSKSNKTLAALREYDRLVKANYLLSYLDDQELRRCVQQTLNKGEAYHQLRRKVASVNGCSPVTTRPVEAVRNLRGDGHKTRLTVAENSQEIQDDWIFRRGRSCDTGLLGLCP
jgi:TnpA family transposase